MIETYLQGGIYEQDMRYGAPFVSKGLAHAVWVHSIIDKNIQKVLCVGCGNGYEVVYWLNQEKDAYGTELHLINCPRLKNRIIAAVFPNSPFKDKEFDFLQCCEVIEHIEPEQSKAFINECLRISKFSMFTIATTMDSFGTHTNIKTGTDWLKFFENLNTQLVHFQYKPVISKVRKERHTYFASGVTILTDNIEYVNENKFL